MRVVKMRVVKKTHPSFIAFCILMIMHHANVCAADRPNILFLFADDLRADALGPYGSKSIQTPNLDRLAARGTTFDRAYIMGGLEGAICTPSRAMLMSGRTLFRVDSQLKEQAAWPGILGANGWNTFITGKWHNGAPSVRRIFQNGQAVFIGGMTKQFGAKIQDFEKEKKAMQNPPITPQHTSEVFADATIEFLRKRQTPFVSYTAFTAPHDPREAPEEFHRRANAARPPIPANFLPQHPFDNGELIVRDEKLEKWPRTPAAISSHLADYKAVIEHLDAQIGRILGALEASGEMENTLIIFAGDNGLAIGSHGLMGKQNCYEHSMRVPLIISGPGLPQQKRSGAMVYLLDLFPTLCALTGQPVPAEVEGREFTSVLRGKTTVHRKRILTAYRGLQRSIRDEQWKLIVYPEIGKSQLFDLQSDPDEIHDLAAKNPQRVTKMMHALEAMQKELGDPLSLRVPNPKPEAWTPPSPPSETPAK